MCFLDKRKEEGLSRITVHSLTHRERARGGAERLCSVFVQIRFDILAQPNPAIRECAGAESDVEFQKIKMAVNLGYIKSGMLDSGLLRKGFNQLDGAIGNIIKVYGATAGNVVVKLSG